MRIERRASLFGNIKNIGVEQVGRGVINLPPDGLGLEQVAQGRLRIALLDLPENPDGSVGVALHQQFDAAPALFAVFRVTLGGARRRCAALRRLTREDKNYERQSRRNGGRAFSQIKVTVSW